MTRALAALSVTAWLAAPARAEEPCYGPPASCDEPDPTYVMRRPQPLWQPLAVTGGGVALIVVGGVLQAIAISTMNQYNEAIGEDCADGGCDPDDVPSAISDLEDRALLENKLAVTSLVIGAVGAVAGLVWVMLDYPRPVRVSPGGFVAEVRF